MLKKTYLKLILLVLPCSYNIHAASSAVTYTFNGGRFGDQLFTYIKAKWVSFIYEIPLLYKPIKFSNQLVLHDHEQHFDKQEAKHYKMIKKITHEHTATIDPKNETLYETSLYFLPSIGRLESNFEYNAKVEGFFNELRKGIMLKMPMPITPLPKEAISIAVHVRKGSGGDQPLSSEQFFKKAPDKSWPTKFPPDQFYIDQIKKIAQQFPDTYLYVYIFTDYKNPRLLADTYNQAINNQKIVFDCRDSSNQETNTILEDFFAMTKFDCLIRPQSAFSICAQLIGNHKIVLFPEKAVWQGSKLIITDVGNITRMTNKT